MPRRTLTSADALTMRAARAAEDPVKMTADATLSRLASHVVALHEENPDLTPGQLAKAARLRLRAEMAALAERGGQLRTARARAAAAGDSA
jgi:hypothetical protein